MDNFDLIELIDLAEAYIGPRGSHVAGRLKKLLRHDSRGVAPRKSYSWPRMKKEEY